MEGKGTPSLSYFFVLLHFLLCLDLDSLLKKEITSLITFMKAKALLSSARFRIKLVWYSRFSHVTSQCQISRGFVSQRQNLHFLTLCYLCVWYVSCHKITFLLPTFSRVWYVPLRMRAGIDTFVDCEWGHVRSMRHCSVSAILVKSFYWRNRSLC